MKLRIALLSTIFILGLTACSLAEDITPPAGYNAPTVNPTNTPVQPTSTSVPAATEVSVSPEATALSATPEIGGTPEADSISTETSGTPTTLTGSVTGIIVSGSDGTLPANLTVTLRGFDMPADQTLNPTESIHQDGTVQPDGSYIFENIEILPGRIFLVEVPYNGIPYQSDYLVANQAPVNLPTLTIYEGTEDLNNLNVEEVHIALDYSTEGVVQIIEMYIMTNTSPYTIVVPTDGTSMPFVHIPAEATNLNFQVASGSAAFVGLETGFALIPLPVEQKYGLVAVFELPYEKKISLTPTFILPAASVTIFAPEGVKVRSDELTDEGVQDFNGTSYQLYKASDVPANTTLTMSISGRPKTTGDTTTTTTISSSTQKWLIIGLGTGGMALIGIGLFLFMRDRKNKDEDEEEGLEEDIDKEEEGETSSIDERDTILDAIIALDEQYKAGEISKSVYEKRRSEFKEQLKRLV